MQVAIYAVYSYLTAQFILSQVEQYNCRNGTNWFFVQLIIVSMLCGHSCLMGKPGSCGIIYFASRAKQLSEWDNLV